MIALSTAQALSTEHISEGAMHPERMKRPSAQNLLQSSAPTLIQEGRELGHDIVNVERPWNPVLCRGAAHHHCDLLKG